MMLKNEKANGQDYFNIVKVTIYQTIHSSQVVLW